MTDEVPYRPPSATAQPRRRASLLVLPLMICQWFAIGWITSHTYYRREQRQQLEQAIDTNEKANAYMRRAIEEYHKARAIYEQYQRDYARPVDPEFAA